jgi:serine/threonine protein kinase
VEYCLFDQTYTFLVEQLPVVIDGKYRLEQLIAHGGMGSVYRAVHQQLERPVAIKILRAEFLADRVIAERFNREARAVAKLKHPNIVAIYDFGSMPNGGAYLVMELIEGWSLREEMRTHSAGHGQMRPERAVATLTQVCAGIEAAHRHGVIHRDLKPDNVMIEATAESAERVLVLDFGIAKLKDRDQGMQGLTDENTVIGTPNYISPEQCTGQTVDARSDIYSLGVILYEMLTGRTPFAGQDTSAVLLRHLQEPPAPPSRFRAGLSRELELVVLRALAKNPSHRFSSAAQFAEHLFAAIRSSQLYVEEVPVESDETVETRARNPVIMPEEMTGVQPKPAFDAQFTGVQLKPIFDAPQFDSPEPPESVDDSPRFNSPGPVESLDVRPPTLLIERQPRTRFNAAVVASVLVLLGVFGYLWMSEWQAEADEAAVTTSSNAAPGGGLTQDELKRLDDANRPEPSTSTGSTGGKTLPASFNKNNAKSDSMNTPANEDAEREVRSVYDQWVKTAVRGDWVKNLSFYADHVEYFRDGKMSRAEVGSRKRRTFSGLDSYTLKFTQAPQIRLRQVNGAQEADVSFDKQWRLMRGRKAKPITGEARGLITLRREPRGGWRIVSEKQIKK